MCGGNDRTQPTGCRIPFGTTTARTSRVRVTLSADRSFHPPPTALAGMPGRWKFGVSPRALRKAQQRKPAFKMNRRSGPRACQHPALRQVPCGSRPAPARMRAPQVGARSNRRTVATHRPAATASLAKGPPSLGRMPERAEARSSGRTTRSVTRPLGRPAFRRVHQRSRRATGCPARFRRNGSSGWIA